MWDPAHTHITHTYPNLRHHNYSRNVNELLWKTLKTRLQNKLTPNELLAKKGER